MLFSCVVEPRRGARPNRAITRAPDRDRPRPTARPLSRSKAKAAHAVGHAWWPGGRDDGEKPERTLPVHTHSAIADDDAGSMASGSRRRHGYVAARPRPAGAQRCRPGRCRRLRAKPAANISRRHVLKRIQRVAVFGRRRAAPRRVRLDYYSFTGPAGRSCHSRGGQIASRSLGPLGGGGRAPGRGRRGATGATSSSL